MTDLGGYNPVRNPLPLNPGTTRWAVERIIDSYTLCMVGAGSQEYVAACADDVLAEVLGWQVRYEPVAAPRPRLLDLCCKAGGASEGYVRAGFRVLGVDIDPQPNYPYEFQQADILDISAGWIANNFDAVHVSPPCQRFSAMSNCRPGLAAQYADLVEYARALLDETGLPYVIENVPGAPLHDPVTLCGFMFGRELYRHRLFETNWSLVQPPHPEHLMPASKAGHWKPGTVMSVAGHVAPVAKAREVMEIDWTTRDELAEAIPPYYSEYVGKALRAAMRNPLRQVAV